MPRLVLCVRKHSAAVSKQNPFDFHKHNLLSAELLVKESRFTDSEEQNQGGPWSGRARLPHRVRVGGSCKPGSEGAPANSCVSEPENLSQLRPVGPGPPRSSRGPRILLQVGSASGEERALSSSRPPCRSGGRALGQSRTCPHPGEKSRPFCLPVGGLGRGCRSPASHLGLLLRQRVWPPPAPSGSHQPCRKARGWTMTRATRVPFQARALQSPKSDPRAHHRPPGVQHHGRL